MGLDGLAIAVVTIGGLTDVHSGRIPNLLTYSAVVVGLIGSLFLPGSNGILNHLLGMAIGFVPLFLLYLRGGLGGGDVKLMAAIGAIKGYPFVLNTMITAILIGGLVAILIVIWEGKLIALLRFVGTTIGRVFYRGLEPETLQAKATLPFGAVLCLGTYLTLIAGWLGHETPASLLMQWH